MIVQQIRNATLKITFLGTTFLVDPWLQDKGAGKSIPTINQQMQGVRIPMNSLPMPIDQILADVDFCLITHIHPDHFTPDYLPLDMKLYMQNEKDVIRAKNMGFMNVQEIPDDGLTINRMLVRKTPAIHGDNNLVAAQMGQVHGYYISGEEKSLYIAGDTVLCKEVIDVLKEASPNVVTLNCCEATLPIGRLIMNLAEINSVCKLVPNARIIATHLDSVNHALLTRDDVCKYVACNGLSQVIVPADGESVFV